MTKFEKARKEITIIERMHEAITDAFHWDCFNYEYDEEAGCNRWVSNPDADPETVELYELWLAKVEKML